MGSLAKSVRFGAINIVAAWLLPVVPAAAGPVNISGTAPTRSMVGQAYAFQPTASVAGNRSVSFSISNKPAWAAFSIATGKLSGTPQSTNVGVHSGIVISVTDGNKTAALAPFAITVAAPVSTTTVSAPTTVVANSAPTISGAPVTQVVAGSAYRFRPTAADSDADTLTFNVANKPAWAVFDAATGTLSGTPTSAQVGSYANIVISVADGEGGSAQLSAFSISVTPASLGRASLSWVLPTENTDGSALTNLAGYRIYYGPTAGGPYASSVTINNPSVSTYLVENLAPGTYYFVVTARNTSGVESAFSGQVATTVN